MLFSIPIIQRVEKELARKRQETRDKKKMIDYNGSRKKWDSQKKPGK